MEGEKIKYSDIIQPDDSIEKLVKQLGELNQQYETMVGAIKTGADRIVQALKLASGATSEGRKSIDEAAASTSRLERAQKELKLAISDTGKQIAWLKAQTVDVNRTTVEQQRYLQQAVSSYDRLKSDLKETVGLYKSLTAAERADSQMGQQLLDDIINLKNQIKALDAEMKPHIETLTEVQKAEQKLAFLQSEEGQKLLELKAKIAEVTTSRKQQTASTDPLILAQEKLVYARSEENEQLKLYSTQIKEANRIAQLQAQIANSSEGSYNRLSAQYELNKIKLNQMSAAQRDAADGGKQLEAETKAIYQQMIKMQEATGNYRLSVGHYQRTWDGLGISISNVVRELPAVAVSINTFLLGISNNIPMVVDEINRLRLQNKALRAEGKKGISVTKSIVKSLFSWNTVLVILLTALSMFGDKIVAWIGKIFSGKKAVVSLEEALSSISEELKTTNANFGANIVSLKKLQEEWKNLRTDAEKTQWIEDNKSKFDELGIAVNNIIEAENAFVNNTDAVIEALRLRAKAEAGKKIASEKYEKALIAQVNAEAEREAGPSAFDKLKATTRTTALKGGFDETYTPGTPVEKVSAEDVFNERIKALEEEAKTAEADGDAYFKLAQGYETAAQAALAAANIKQKADDKTESERRRDLTNIVYRTNLAVTKKQEQSITALERDEYEKRKKQASDAANAQIRELEETNRKIVDYLEDRENKYEELTDEERNILIQNQEQIRQAITNINEQLSYDLEQIEIDKQIRLSEIEAEGIALRLQALKKGSAEEFELRKNAADIAIKIALLKNRKKPVSEQLSEADITSAETKTYNLSAGQLLMEEFEQLQALEEEKFNAIERSEIEITRFKLQQEKERWEKQIRLAKDGALDWSDIQVETAKQAVLNIDKELSKIKGFKGFLKSVGQKGLGGSLLESLGFNDEQIDALSTAVNTVVGYLQEIADAEVQLAEKAVEAAQMRVEAAQKSYDAEIEARNNGYANSVATAKKELEQEKRNQQLKQKQLEEAQRRQEAINTITQASSLITASANLWSSFSSIPVVGPALAAVAIAGMWTSFLAAKMKARQVTASSEQYGEGGIEFLEGGSHASGNDIDLGTSNKKGKRMRAEGGEALAIINRKQTRKYRKILPDVVDSFNKGVFEEKYLRAFAGSSGLNISLDSEQPNLLKLEEDVSSIRKQNETRYYNLPDGTTVVHYKNVKRIIKNN